MSYENLVPTIESEYILKERDRFLVFGNNCTRKYEGEISKAGEKITIYVEGNPTIYVLEKNGTYTANGTDYNGTSMSGNIAGSGKDLIQEGIPSAETMPFGEVLLEVNKVALFNVKVGDIDKKLASKKGLMGSIRRAIGKQIAKEQDMAIAKTIFGYADSKAPTSVFNQASETIVAGTAASGQVNVLDLIDKVVEEFNNRDVADGVKIACEASPKFARYVRAAMRNIDTDNSGILNHRKCPVYNDVYVVKTNNCKINGTEHACFRTTDAVAFFDPFMKIEPYRLQNGFTDCLKGFQLFDCGIVKPREVMWIQPQY